jgi:hypothetical protein
MSNPAFQPISINQNLSFQAFSAELPGFGVQNPGCLVSLETLVENGYPGSWILQDGMT